jgi:outer membrane protein assembly factor BamB
VNAHGRVACLDAASGKELWAVDVLERYEGKQITWAISECLLVDGPRVIVTPGGRKALMVALDKTDGKEIWATEPLDPDTANYSSPILFRHGGRRLLVNCSSEHLFGVDADAGKLLWAEPMKTPNDVNAGMPVYGDGRIHVATPYITMGCYQLLEQGTKVELAWPTPLDTCTGSFVLAGGVLYAGGWQDVKSWIAIDWKSGETRGALKELRTGSALFADGRLYCLAEDGRVALVTPVSEGFTIAGEFRLARARENDAWAHPVLLDGRLYLRYHDTLACYDVRAK